MKKVSVLIASMFFASSAYAGNFEGFSVFAKAGVQSTDTEIKYNEIGEFAESGKTDGNGRSNFVGGIGADYGFKINNNFVTLVGIEGNLNSIDAYKEKDSGFDYDFKNDEQIPESSSTKIKQKNTYGIYIAPGYLINDNALVYAKFSYNRTKLELKVSDTYDGVTDSYKQSENFDGYGFGVGARLFFANNVFVNAEWQKIQYSSEKFNNEDSSIKFKPDSTVGTIAIGYNF